METAQGKPPEPVEQAAPGEARRGRKARQLVDEPVRFFLAKEGSALEKPELGPEISTEGEALIKAFQSKSGIIYALLAYKAEAEIQGASPTLVKRPLRK